MPARELDVVWRALADPTRRRLLDLLRDRPRTTSELCEPFGTSRFAIMKHLAVLEDAGLVLVRRRGRERWNHLNAAPIRQVYERWVSRFAGRWAASMLELKRFVEKDGGTELSASHSSPISSFRIEQELRIRGPRVRVFAALTTEIGHWWPFRIFDDAAHPVSLEPRLGGRFMEGDERLGVLWGQVSEIRPPELLRVAGPLGMSGRAVASVFAIELLEERVDTVLRLSHSVVGDLDPNWEQAHREGWHKLLHKSLRDYVERGVRYEPGGA